MIIMAIMANTSRASVISFKGKLKNKEAKTIKAVLPKAEMNRSVADFETVSYNGNETTKIANLSKPECKLSDAGSETVEYTVSGNQNNQADFETVTYQID